MRKTSRNTIILYLLMTLIASLSACGDVSITGTANIGGKASDKITNLYSGPCAKWDIVGEYEDLTFSGACEMSIQGDVFHIDDAALYDDDFESTQLIYGFWESDNTAEMCRFSKNHGTITVSCTEFVANSEEL